MFKFTGFSAKANVAVNLAIAQASALGHTYVGSEHLLIGLLEEPSGTAGVALRSRGINPVKVQQKLIETVGRGIRTQLTPDNFTPRCKKILEGALTETRILNAPITDTEHILMALLKEKESYAVRFLTAFGTDANLLYRDIVNQIGNELIETIYMKGKRQPPPKQKQTTLKGSALEKFSRDLTAWAREGKLDPVIGRDEEIFRTLQILSRRTKNNPCLIGEAGVGKTAVVEGLAQLLLSDEAPDYLQGVRVLSLDLTNMIAGTKFRGEFEERVRDCIEEVIEQGNIILFIDEIHNIIGAGAAEGAIDAANILKPQLARGELQIIGATTVDEYRRHIEKDSALARRFQSVVIDEPDEEKTLAILKGLRERYELHHQVIVSDEALEAAVGLASRYITERFLPDKAIDLLDEAASYARLQANKKAKEYAYAAKPAQDTYPWQLDNSVKPVTITKKEIAAIASSITGIPAPQLLKDQNERLLELENILHKKIVGQQEAVSALARAIRRCQSGLRDPKRPIGSFLFLGPSGVGKTALCQALSGALFAKDDALLRFDMSEYMEKHSVSRLIGTPPGYIGYDDGGQLTERVRRNPYSVVLFDEVEKAHPDVFNLLLQVLEDGHLTDSSGRKTDFRNCILIMTSNIGADKIARQKKVGFSSGDNRTAETNNEIKNELKQFFRPEFLNRVDEFIYFKHLSKEEVQIIAARMLDELQTRLGEVGIRATIDKKSIEKIVDENFSLDDGARPLRREIQKKIEDPLAWQYLSGSFSKGDSIYCELAEELVIEKTGK